MELEQNGGVAEGTKDGIQPPRELESQAQRGKIESAQIQARKGCCMLSPPLHGARSSFRRHCTPKAEEGGQLPGAPTQPPPLAGWSPLTWRQLRQTSWYELAWMDASSEDPHRRCIMRFTSYTYLSFLFPPQKQHNFHQHCVFIPRKLRFITGLDFPLCVGFVPSVEVLLPQGLHLSRCFALPLVPLCFHFGSNKLKC